jgi:hypothetical protein
LEAIKKSYNNGEIMSSVRVCQVQQQQQQQLGIINTKALRCKKIVEGRAGSA